MAVKAFDTIRKTSIQLGLQLGVRCNLGQTNSVPQYTLIQLFLSALTQSLALPTDPISLPQQPVDRTKIGKYKGHE